MLELESWLSQHLNRSIHLARSNVHVPGTSIPDMNPSKVQELKNRVNDIYAQDLDLISRYCPLKA